jgi:protocatechuate 3,4-dioxygenase alpha subunit
MPLPLTPSQTVGPFFSFGLCDRPSAELATPDTAGALRIHGTVFDGQGETISDAMIEIWQADPQGHYEGTFGWGRVGTDDAGRYELVTVKPGGVPGPDNRPQAPHLEMLVFARGLLKPLLTRMYFPDEREANASDLVLCGLEPAEAETLVAQTDDGALRFDLRLQGERQTTFFALTQNRAEVGEGVS